MFILAITNQKGGTGKTTTAVCLAAALAERGRRVLLIDLDSQCNASRWMGGNTEASGIFEVLIGGADLESVVQENPNGADQTLWKDAAGVDLVASSPHMVGAERALASDPAPQFILRDALKSLNGSTRDYDYCLMDCPAALGTVTVNALTAADGVLVPVLPETLSLEGLADLVRTVQTVQSRLNPALRLAGILANRADSRKRITHEVIGALRARFPGETLQTVIRDNVRLSEAPSHRLPITAYDPSSYGAEDYRALADELERRL